MKRWLAALLCAAVALGSGCAYVSQQAAKEKDCYSLYFAVDNLSGAGGGDAIGKTTCSVEKDSSPDEQVLARQLMTQLLAGPDRDAENLKTPFPSGTQLLSVTLDGSRALVDLSAAYSMLSGVALTIADYCIVLTLTQLPGVYTVAVTVRGQELAWNAQVFSAGDVLLSTTEDVVGTVDVELFFPDKAGALTAERRTLSLYEGDTQAGTLVEALEKGPESKDLLPVLPKGFTVLSVWMEQETCYVNLPSSALKTIPAEADMPAAFRALTRSLYSLPGVSEVQFLVDGEFTSSYGGVSISRPFIK
ncbi:MAG: GerMN domain-containing protein [Oscillibacter sp.]|jgi:germination protein M|nr:GerMN domain-containing protein [Oscillibacter sp.]